jgi:hypothetical protein
LNLVSMDQMRNGHIVVAHLSIRDAQDTKGTNGTPE